MHHNVQMDIWDYSWQTHLPLYFFSFTSHSLMQGMFSWQLSKYKQSLEICLLNLADVYPRLWEGGKEHFYK